MASGIDELVNMLYDMIKNPVWYDCNKQMAAIKFLLFLEWNNALFVDGEKRISDALLVALILVIEKSRDEARQKIAEASQQFKQERSHEISEYKSELYGNIAREKENLKNIFKDSAIEIEHIIRVIIVIFSSTVYSLSVIWFLEPAGLIAIDAQAYADEFKKLKRICKTS